MVISRYSHPIKLCQMLLKRFFYFAKNSIVHIGKYYYKRKVDIKYFIFIPSSSVWVTRLKRSIALIFNYDSFVCFMLYLNDII